MAEYCANPRKKLVRRTGDAEYLRIPIQAPVITGGGEAYLVRVIQDYAGPKLKQGDILFFSEKAVACAQGRAIRVEDIHPRKLAVWLSHFVTKTPVGIGLGIPETMEIALRECGTVRILAAACCGAVGRLFGKRGWFYVVAGPKARGIDGPTSGTIPPYNRCVVPTPEQPEQLAVRLSNAVGYPVAIVDINDLGANILGYSHQKPSVEQLCEILRDNPLGQGHEATPLGIIRRLPDGVSSEQ